MNELRKRIAVLLVAVLVLSLGMTVSANGPISTGDIIFDYEMSPFDYDEPPENYEVFIYRGSPPRPNTEIDTTGCVIGRLYVYNKSTRALLEVSEEAISTYTSTLTALYYVTETYALYKTDYNGANHQLLYQGNSGEISNLAGYYDLLYFIENGNQIVMLDATTGESAAILSFENLDWLFMLNEAEILFVTLDEDCYIYNLFTRDITQLSGMMEATDRISYAVHSTYETETPDVSVMAVFDGIMLTQSNDISLPLAEYPVLYHDNANVLNFGHTRPISWFHHNKAEGCENNNCKGYAGTAQCEGFAMYVHDTYMHMENMSANHPETWSTYRHRDAVYYDGDSTNNVEFANSEDAGKVKNFFQNMKSGSYVRYGKFIDKDPTPEDGCHSILFLASDNNGIWVYECNQEYYKRLSDSERANKPEEYFGCGVFIQYYTYVQIATTYRYILYYVEHTYSNEYENTSTHKAQCTQCVGYLRQPHTSGIKIKSTTQHGHACCTGGESNHTGTATYQRESSSKHRVSYSCCSGSILEEHTFNNAPIRKCLICGQVMEGGIMEPITPTMLPPAEVTLTE